MFRGVKLRALAVKAQCLAAGSKSKATVKRYNYYWQKFVSWCNDKELRALPAPPEVVGLYFAHVADTCRSISTVNAHFYSVKWMHKFCGYDDPTSHSLPINIAEGVRRNLIPNKNFKKPADVKLLVNICSVNFHYLRDSRIAAMCSVGFAGFFRIGELLKIKRADLVFFDNYFQVKIRNSKTDVYSRGNLVSISKGSTCACPRKNLLLYLKQASLLDAPPEKFIFRGLEFRDGRTFLKRENKPLTYKAARKELSFYLQKCGYLAEDYAWHSFRHGGATKAASAGVSDRLFKKHGRWQSERAKDSYVHESFSDMLSVSKCLGL